MPHQKQNQFRPDAYLPIGKVLDENRPEQRVVGRSDLDRNGRTQTRPEIVQHKGPRGRWAAGGHQNIALPLQTPIMQVKERPLAHSICIVDDDLMLSFRNETPYLLLAQRWPGDKDGRRPLTPKVSEMSL